MQVILKVLNTPLLSFVFLILVGCNPYLTRSVDGLKSYQKGDSIYVAYPIIECRRQVTKDYYYKEYGALRPADSLTNKALHELLDKSLSVKYADLNNYEVERKSKIIMDSILKVFKEKKLNHFTLKQKLDFPTKANLILIPYLIWTRSTEDYDKGKCGNGKFRARYHGSYTICTWTQSQTFLLMIDRKHKEVVYFKYSQWDSGDIFMPYEKRVTLNFKHCAKPLLRKLGR